MKRLFAALKIDPDAEFLTKYRKLKHELRNEQIKWVEERNIHITLKFFGDTPDGDIARIITTLENRSFATACLNFQLSGLGIFGSSYAPRVIWVGIAPYDELSSLMKSIQVDLQRAGYEPDRQNLVPHLTLGRIKLLRDKIIFNRTIDQFKSISSLPIRIHEVILFESILHREGPEYIALEKFPFLKKEHP
jgi:2'-5' RNA ligase